MVPKDIHVLTHHAYEYDISDGKRGRGDAGGSDDARSDTGPWTKECRQLREAAEGSNSLLENPEETIPSTCFRSLVSRAIK